MNRSHPRGTLTVVVVRRGLVFATAATLAFSALELLVTRHWGKATRNIPWVVLAYLLVVFVVALRGSGRGWAVRSAALLGLIASLFGVIEHVEGNYAAGPLDYRFTARWPDMSTPSRLWAAVNGSVGPAPLLAPLVLAQAAVLVFLVATLTGRTQETLS